MKKNKLPMLLLTALAFLLISVWKFYDYAVGIDKGMSLVGGIIFGILALVYIHDLYEFMKNKKSINSGTA
jgi:hypothetical protein